MFLNWLLKKGNEKLTSIMRGYLNAKVWFIPKYNIKIYFFVP